jgi:hypothetical protein
LPQGNEDNGDPDERHNPEEGYQVGEVLINADAIRIHGDSFPGG